MSDALSFAELEAQDVQLLPARTVLSIVSLSPGGSHSHGGSGVHGSNGVGVNGIGVGVNPDENINIGGHQINIAGQGIPGNGGA